MVAVDGAGVETIVMAGWRGMYMGWTISTAGTGTGVWIGGKGWMGVRASMGWTIGTAGTCVQMGAGKGGSYICESGRGGTFRFIFRFGYGSSSLSVLHHAIVPKHA